MTTLKKVLSYELQPRVIASLLWKQRKAIIFVTIILILGFYALDRWQVRRNWARRYLRPAMVKWYGIFNINPRTQTHPVKFERIQQNDAQELYAEIPHSYDLLRHEGWGESLGKFCVVINGSTDVGSYVRATNGNTLVWLNKSELKAPTNRVRLDINVNDPTSVASLHAKGPTVNLVWRNDSLGIE